MTRVQIIFITLVSLVTFSACALFSTASVQKDHVNIDAVEIPPPLPDNRPKNVIMMIGDGMGLEQISASMYAKGKQSVFDKFTDIGIQKTYSADSITTDSGASATAFSSGSKTNNRMIGMKPDSSVLYSIMEEAIDMGMYTGLVVSSTIVHATPAPFYAHTESRYNYEDIAIALLEKEPDYFVGGGLKYFLNRESDSRDLYQEFEEAGYKMGNYFDHEFDDFSFDREAKFGFITSWEDPLPRDQGREYLLPASISALDYLDGREAGFFLLIEGSQIDWGGHDNISSYVLSEMEEFEQIINEVLEFAETDGETLLIITADHETGGLNIEFDSKPDSLSYSFSSIHHTANMVPLFSYGPGSEYFRGMYENTEIYHKMRKALGWE